MRVNAGLSYLYMEGITLVTLAKNKSGVPHGEKQNPVACLTGTQGASGMQVLFCFLR